MSCQITTSAACNLLSYNSRQARDKRLFERAIGCAGDEPALAELYSEYVVDNYDIWPIVKALCEVGSYELAEYLCDYEGLSIVDCPYPEIFFHAQPSLPFMKRCIPKLNKELVHRDNTLLEFYTMIDDQAIVQELLRCGFTAANNGKLTRYALEAGNLSILAMFDQRGFFEMPSVKEHPDCFVLAVCFIVNTGGNFSIDNALDIFEKNHHIKKTTEIAAVVDWSDIDKSQMQRVFNIGNLELIEFLHRHRLLVIPKGREEYIFKFFATRCSFDLFVYAFSKFVKSITAPWKRRCGPRYSKLLGQLAHAGAYRKLIFAIENRPEDAIITSVAEELVVTKMSKRPAKYTVKLIELLSDYIVDSKKVFEYCIWNKCEQGADYILAKIMGRVSIQSATYILKLLLRREYYKIIEKFVCGIEKYFLLNVISAMIANNGNHHKYDEPTAMLYTILLDNNLFGICAESRKFPYFNYRSERLSKKWLKLVARIAVAYDAAIVNIITDQPLFIMRLCKVDAQLAYSLIVCKPTTFIPIILKLKGNITQEARNVVNDYYNDVIDEHNIATFSDVIINDYINQCHNNIRSDSDREYFIRLLFAVTDKIPYYQQLLNKTFCEHIGLPFGQGFDQDIKLNVSTLLMLGKATVSKK